MKSNYRRIGDFIERIKVKNVDNQYSKLLGININKYFMPSVANVVGTDLSKYKIVKPGQFACNRMHVGRDYRLPIALSKENKPFIVSPAYDVFEIINDELLPEYLMMWFSRAEFDRNTWFYTDTDVRGKLGWDSLCDMTLPVPHIDQQRAIVREYQAVTKRIRLNEQVNKSLEATAQALYKHWFIDFEFPDENNQPYKSSGGKMVFNEELEKEIPVEWEVERIDELFVLQRGFDLPKRSRKNGIYPIYASTGIISYHSECKVNPPGVVTGRSGSLGEVFYVEREFWPLNTTLWIKEFKKVTPSYAYLFLINLNILEFGSGSAVPTLNRNHVHMAKTYVPNSIILSQFESIFLKINNFNNITIKLNQALTQLQTLLLSRMSTYGGL